MNQIKLQTPVRYLKGVGPERSKLLLRLELETVEDLFYFFPRRYENRFPVKKIAELTREGKECAAGTVMSRGLIRTRHGQSIFRTVLSDGKNTLFGVWFNQPYLSKVFLPKTQVIFYGQVEKAGKHLQMLHPEYEIPKGDNPGDSIHVGRIVPIYPLTEELSQKTLRSLLYQAVDRLAWLLKEPLSFSLRKKTVLVDRVFAFKQIHFPQSTEDLKRAYRRLVFDEFFMMQLIVQSKKRSAQKENQAILHLKSADEIRRFIETLEFDLTGGQKTAIEDILNDMKKPQPMNRLVQGDVGSGKTVVAAAGLLFTVKNGFQGALMAPTEVLAQQHYYKLMQFFEPLGIACAYLAQGISVEARQRLLQGLRNGEIQVVVGTHALIEPEVKFKRLGLVVVDEQHKFGVFQRAELKTKSGEPAHFLLMTATPIPRTLAMTLYGDLDISTMPDLPAGRRPVRTFWVNENRRREVYQLLEEEIKRGRQGYVICPLIDERGDFSEKSVLSAYKEMQDFFSHRKIGILHGRMKPDQKRKIMKQFKEGALELLVATVVIEVGIDVPNATFILIENAEKFGLSQLHQLRGRVGRRSEESLCVLFSDAKNQETVERLHAFEESESGFEIAEKDLALRGAGDLVGKRQHGLPSLRIGDLVKDMDILELARREAKAVVDEDPELKKKEHWPLKREMERRFKAKEDKLAVAG